ncbi:MAG: hypothetical protein WD696_15205 [Bryobacteraceae bacterium]
MLPAFGGDSLTGLRKSVLLATFILLAACSRSIDTKEAVRQGVVDYLADRSNVNVSAMTVDVRSVSFRGDEADAMVAFTVPGGQGGSLEMRYVLERKSGKWVVKSKSESGGMPHGAGGDPGDSAPAPGALPPGHPPLSEPKK